MGDFKWIKGLTVKVPDHDALITVQNPVEVMAINPELDVLCIPIQPETVSAKTQQTEARRLGMNRDIGTGEKPVRLGERFEGFKLNRVWIYRNSNPDKPNFCRKWLSVIDCAGIAKFDDLYVESLGDEKR